MSCKLYVTAGNGCFCCKRKKDVYVEKGKIVIGGLRRPVRFFGGELSVEFDRNRYE